jgi:hypothetical protein
MFAVSPRLSVDRAALDDLIRANERVLTHAQLRAFGMHASTISHRIGVRGPWQRLLPGVVLTHRGTPSHRERQLAALGFAGNTAVITGLDALRVHGVRTEATSPVIHVLVPIGRQRRSFGFVRVERTRRMPVALPKQGLPWAGAARATVDACRHLEDLDCVRDLVASVVQRGICDLDALTVEVGSAARQRTALSRRTLAEMSVGVRSVAEARARDILAKHGVPAPLWNVELRTATGQLLARPDAYWEDVAAAMEIDSMAWHLGPQQYRRTQARQRLLTVHGVLVLPIAPRDILDDEIAFVRQVLGLLDRATRRPAPDDLVVVRRPL